MVSYRVGNNHCNTLFSSESGFFSIIVRRVGFCLAQGELWNESRGSDTVH